MYYTYDTVPKFCHSKNIFIPYHIRMGLMQCSRLVGSRPIFEEF